MANKFNSIDEVFDHIETRTEFAMRSNVIDLLVNRLNNHIRRDIYLASRSMPGTGYRRRNSLRGSAFGEYDKGTHTAWASSAAPANESWVTGFSEVQGVGNFLNMLGGDFGGYNPGLWTNGFPRPALTLAQKDINTLDILITEYLEEDIYR